MLSKQDVANLALGHLGVSQSVLDLTTENTTQAKIIRRHFRFSLDAMLEAHDWNFATQRTALVLIAENPLSTMRYTYALPADCLVARVIAEDGHFPERKQYEVEKLKWREFYNGSGPRTIHTHVRKAHIEYTTRISEEASFPNHFARGLSHMLALDIAPSLITNNFPKVKDALMQTSMNELSKAMAADIGREPLIEDTLSQYVLARHLY